MERFDLENSTPEAIIGELRRRIDYTKLVLDDDIYERSTISQVFKGKSVFLTGGAGFLGQIYIEKLLRIGVKRIYCLLRSKKKLTAKERLDEICLGPLFQRLREKDPNFAERISVINGDLELLQAGISDNDVQLLCDEVDIVIHAAADVRFNIPLMDLVRSNVRGTRELLDIAVKMKSLQVFAYISTAYSHCPRDTIEEKFYEPPMDPFFWLDALEAYKTQEERDLIEVFERHIMDPWPNSYTFAKALSEHVVKSYSHRFPTVVIRPSIIVSTYQDPIGGWTNNITGINGLCVGIGVGFLRHLHVKTDYVIDIICADFVTNTTLAAMWTAVEKHEASGLQVIPAPEVYHVTSKGFRLTAGRLVNDSITMRKFELLHTMKIIYYPVITLVQHEWQDTLATIFLGAIPAFIMDFFNPEKIKLLAVSRKVKSMKDVISFFMGKQIQFGNSNVLKIYERMSDADKQLYPADSRKLDWSKFIYPYYGGIRQYVLMDPLDTYPQSKIKLQKLKYVHYTLKYSFISIMIWLFYIFVLSKLLALFV